MQNKISLQPLAIENTWDLTTLHLNIGIHVSMKKAQSARSRKRDIAIFRFWAKINDVGIIGILDKHNAGLSSYIGFCETV